MTASDDGGILAWHRVPAPRVGAPGPPEPRPLATCSKERAS